MRRGSVALVAVLLGSLVGCSGAGASTAGTSSVSSTAVSTSTSVSTSTALSTAVTSTSPPAAGITKVLVIAEENETYGSVMGSGHAPYLDSVAEQFATATAMDAGYPPSCPSLAAYLLMTSGDRYKICDDSPPSAHPIRADNIFQQVAASGREWRNYAESMPAPCTRKNSGHFLVRHAPAPYFVSEASRCPRWMLPLGTLTSGALHDDVAAGTLPGYGFVTPDECNDMHGGPNCPGANLVSTGDTWLRHWTTQVMAGPDYRAGRLMIVVTWDEGDARTNHIPMLVISPATHHVTISRPITQCHLLRTIDEVLRVPPLGCAARAFSLAADLGLTSSRKGLTSS